MTYATTYIVIGLVVLALVRTRGLPLPPSGVLRAVFLWPVVVFAWGLDRVKR